MPGVGEWMLIMGVLVLLFGAKKLPELGGAIGESIKNFKKGVSAEEKPQAPLPPGNAQSDKEPPKQA